MTNSIFITGASGGIGAAVAGRFLDGGWQVGLMARRRGALETVAGGHRDAHVFAGDVTDEAAVEAAMGDFAAKTGGLGALFNNAGIFVPAAPIDELSLSDWREAIDINLTGMFIAAKSAFGIMRRQEPRGGRIINNGSISAHVPREGAAAYTASKHGVTGLTRQISLDGRDLDIACSQIDIGNARTALLEGIAAASDTPVHMIELSTVADAVWSMATLPPGANMQFMTLMATKMPFIGRG